MTQAPLRLAFRAAGLFKAPAGETTRRESRFAWNRTSHYHRNLQSRDRRSTEDLNGKRQ
jgi:hypothetical protein